MVAVVAEAIAAIAWFSFMLGDITPRRACTVVVVHALVSGFYSFVDGIERGRFWHCNYPSWFGFSWTQRGAREGSGQQLNPMRGELLSESHTLSESNVMSATLTFINFLSGNASS